MGLYLEPQINKRNWLDENANFLIGCVGNSNIDFDSLPENKVFVCLVYNGFFLAAAVAFNEREFEEFNTPDGRPKYWYSVDKEKAKSIAPNWDDYFR